MVGATKILTVSYGTFSCTLEGFDDPFDTMKSIAEYFRDLAADDRYFGAEPPTPDATMLHRIAEREVKRRVEAKIEDNGVILRAGDGAGPAEGASTAPAHATAPAATAATGLLSDDSIAAKLQRIRSAVALSAAAGAAPQPDIEDAVFVEDVAEGPAQAPAPAAATGPAHPPEPTPESLPEPVLAGPEPVPPTVAEAPAPPEASGESAEAEVPESLLAVLAAIGIDTPPPTADEPLGADPAEDTEADTLRDAAGTEPGPQAVADLDCAEPPDDGLSVAAQDLSPYPDAGPVAATGPVDDPASDPVETAEADDAGGKAVGDGFSALAHATGPLPDTAPDTADDEPPVPTTEAVEGVALVGDAGDAEAPGADAARLAESLRRARARVIKVRRHDGAPPAEAGEPDSDPPATEREGRPALHADPDADEAVNRLLRQTNSEMEGVDQRRRLSTIAHLKAAVAATVADLRAPSGARSQPARAEPYRADLASVMHPAAGGGSSESDRLAPLMLGPTLRIDPPAREAEPAPARVLPRRVSAVAPDAAALSDVPSPDGAPQAQTGDATSVDFAAFADRLGASTMPDLLEAAAAYTVCVEGQPHFTRPHLMRHVADLSDRYLGHREDEMRGFGELLRQGRIAKVRRGQFVIPESSRMLAEARRISH